MRRNCVAPVVVALLVASCGGPRKPQPAKAVDAPGTLRSRDGTVSLRMPAGWIVVDGESAAFRAFASKMGAANPSIKQLVRQSSGTVLLAVSAVQAKAKAKILDTVGITRRPSQGRTGFSNKEIPEFKRGYAKVLNVDGPLAMDVRSMKIGQALHYEARVKLKQPGSRDIAMEMIGYMLPRGADMYMVTFSGAPDHAKVMAKIADIAVDTLQIR